MVPVIYQGTGKEIAFELLKEAKKKVKRVFVL